MIKTLIIDDSEKALNSLMHKLREHCPQIEIVGTAQSFDEGKHLIENIDADLLFLDIELGNKNGFDLLLETRSENLKVIFTTGHTGYSIKAFKFNAVHYLLKPIDDVDLKVAVERVSKMEKNNLNDFGDLQNLLNQIRNPKKKKLLLATEKGTLFIDIENIVYLKSDGSYTEIYLESGEMHIASKNLKEFEAGLPASFFFRISKLYIINLYMVDMMSREDGGVAIMNTGVEIIIPRRKRREFLIKMAELE